MLYVVCMYLFKYIVAVEPYINYSETLARGCLS